jgi:hypothetical protein
MCFQYAAEAAVHAVTACFPESLARVLHGKARAASMIANQPEAADDVDKSHKSGMVLSRNRFPWAAG